MVRDWRKTGAHINVSVADEGPPGNAFAGSCSTHVDLEDAGSGRVIFKQSIEGQHWWVVRVQQGHGRLVRDWGAELVERIR